MARRPVRFGLSISPVDDCRQGELIVGKEKGRRVMTKAKKRGKQAGAKKQTSKRKRQRDIGSQTEQPFEQDSKRRIGQYGGTGEPPIMK
jgi:hypothetical protein